LNYTCIFKRNPLFATVSGFRLVAVFSYFLPFLASVCRKLPNQNLTKT